MLLWGFVQGFIFKRQVGSNTGQQTNIAFFLLIGWDCSSALSIAYLSSQELTSVVSKAEDLVYPNSSAGMMKINKDTCLFYYSSLMLCLCDMLEVHKNFSVQDGMDLLILLIYI